MIVPFANLDELEIVDEKDAPAPINRGRPAYPWREWIAKGTVVLTQGKDYRCKARSLAQLAYWACPPLGYNVSARIRKDRQSIMLTFSPVNESAHEIPGQDVSKTRTYP